MKLEMLKESSKDVWNVLIVMPGDEPDEVFELDTRGQVYSLIRHARELRINDDRITLSRTLQANYGFEGE